MLNVQSTELSTCVSQLYLQQAIVEKKPRVFQIKCGTSSLLVRNYHIIITNHYIYILAYLSSHVNRSIKLSYIINISNHHDMTKIPKLYTKIAGEYQYLLSKCGRSKYAEQIMTVEESFVICTTLSFYKNKVFEASF